MLNRRDTAYSKYGNWVCQHSQKETKVFCTPTYADCRSKGLLCFFACAIFQSTLLQIRPTICWAVQATAKIFNAEEDSSSLDGRAATKEATNTTSICNKKPSKVREILRFEETTRPHMNGSTTLSFESIGVLSVYAIQTLLDEQYVQQIFVPVAVIGKQQPLDVEVIRPFRVYYKEEYQRQRKNHTDLTPGGYLRKPGRQDFINMVSVAWAKLTSNCIKKSLEGGGRKCVWGRGNLRWTYMIHRAIFPWNTVFIKRLFLWRWRWVQVSVNIKLYYALLTFFNLSFHAISTSSELIGIL